jgi:hypothetical protein
LTFSDLLNRDKHLVDSEEEEKENQLANEYLASFKVAGLKAGKSTLNRAVLKDHNGNVPSLLHKA